MHEERDSEETKQLASAEDYQTKLNWQQKAMNAQWREQVCKFKGLDASATN